MQGKDTIFVPGLDDAGIEMQASLIHHLSGDVKPTASDYRILATHWKQKQEERIVGQISQLGAAMTWPTYTYTMSEHYNQSIKYAFQRLLKQKDVYRANRMCNWCPSLMSIVDDTDIEIKKFTQKTDLEIPGINV